MTQWSAFEGDDLPAAVDQGACELVTDAGLDDTLLDSVGKFNLHRLKLTTTPVTTATLLVVANMTFECVFQQLMDRGRQSVPCKHRKVANGVQDTGSLVLLNRRWEL